MAVRVVEIRPQNFSGGRPVKRYLFRDLDDALAVDAHLQTFADIDLEYGGLPIDLSGRSIQELGGNEWYVEIPYSARAGNIVQPGAGSATSEAPKHGGEDGANEPVMRNISYGVRGGTQKITQSIQTIKKAATQKDGLPRVARDFGNAIGVTDKNGEMEVEGADVLSGEVTWQYTAQIPDASFTGAYATIIENLMCSPNNRRHCKNAAEFFGYAAGEVLLVGYSVSELDGSGYRKMNFEFAVKRNRETVIISTDPALQLANVGGWSYIWVTYEKQTTTVDGKNRTRMVPFEAYEEEVYEDGDFAALQLETYRVEP